MEIGPQEPQPVQLTLCANCGHWHPPLQCGRPVMLQPHVLMQSVVDLMANYNMMAQDRMVLMQRLQQLEERVNELEAEGEDDDGAIDGEVVERPGADGETGGTRRATPPEHSADRRTSVLLRPGEC